MRGDPDAVLVVLAALALVITWAICTARHHP